MRHHAVRLLSALAAVAGCAGLLAGPGHATVVHVNVVNDAAPVVRIVSPADGARFTPGSPIEVHVEGENADTLAMSVNGAPTWAGAGDVLTESWSPSAGTYRLVAVAERSGAPDAVASSTVEVLEAGPGSGAAPTEPPAPGGAATPASPRSPGAKDPLALALPGARRRARHRAAVAPAAPATTARRSAARAGTPAGRSLARHNRSSPVMALVRAIRRLLSSPERVAWVVAFPLLLIIFAVAYALLQRFIDGGPKLAWRGRGPSDDSVIEF